MSVTRIRNKSKFITVRNLNFYNIKNYRLYFDGKQVKVIASIKEVSLIELGKILKDENIFLEYNLHEYQKKMPISSDMLKNKPITVSYKILRKNYKTKGKIGNLYGFDKIMKAINKNKDKINFLKKDSIIATYNIKDNSFTLKYHLVKLHKMFNLPIQHISTYIKSEKVTLKV